MITVCLLSCGRPNLTAATARSFSSFNGGRSDLTRLHIDVGSEDELNARVASWADFRTILQTQERLGQMETLRLFAERIAGDWVLWLENDWESVGALPPADFFERASSLSIPAMRLYGERKMRGNSPRAFAGPHCMGTKEPIRWTPFSQGWEIGQAHWGGGGCLLTAEAFKRAATYPRLKDFMTVENALPTLRPTENIMFHIGTKTTPGFRD